MSGEKDLNQASSATPQSVSLDPTLARTSSLTLEAVRGPGPGDEIYLFSIFANLILNETRSFSQIFVFSLFFVVIYFLIICKINSFYF